MRHCFAEALLHQEAFLVTLVGNITTSWLQVKSYWGWRDTAIAPELPYLLLSHILSSVAKTQPPHSPAPCRSRAQRGWRSRRRTPCPTRRCKTPPLGLRCVSSSAPPAAAGFWGRLLASEGAGRLGGVARGNRGGRASSRTGQGPAGSGRWWTAWRNSGYG